MKIIMNMLKCALTGLMSPAATISVLFWAGLAFAQENEKNSAENMNILLKIQADVRERMEKTKTIEFQLSGKATAPGIQIGGAKKPMDADMGIGAKKPEEKSPSPIRAPSNILEYDINVHFYADDKNRGRIDYDTLNWSSKDELYLLQKNTLLQVDGTSKTFGLRPGKEDFPFLEISQRGKMPFDFTTINGMVHPLMLIYKQKSKIVDEVTDPAIVSIVDEHMTGTEKSIVCYKRAPSYSAYVIFCWVDLNKGSLPVKLVEEHKGQRIKLVEISHRQEKTASGCRNPGLRNIQI